ncbi:MAG: DUF2284 domain-containing protein [Eubacteriales bacterium]|nr:DUF2284 domain-containing protein [Eubacteriales bacterium]
MRYVSYVKPVPTKAYVEKYVDPDFFLTKCQACSGFGTSWACPPFDADPMDYWNKFKIFIIVCQKLIFDEADKEAYRNSPVDVESHVKKGEVARDGIFNINLVLDQHTQALNKELYRMEELFPGGEALISGQCDVCGKSNCSRLRGIPCLFPDKKRHSLESIGGNCVDTITDFFGFDMKWVEDGELPDYFVQIGGLLLPE